MLTHACERCTGLWVCPLTPWMRDSVMTPLGKESDVYHISPVWENEESHSIWNLFSSNSFPPSFPLSLSLSIKKEIYRHPMLLHYTLSSIWKIISLICVLLPPYTAHSYLTGYSGYWRLHSRWFPWLSKSNLPGPLLGCWNPLRPSMQSFIMSRVTIGLHIAPAAQDEEFSSLVICLFVSLTMKIVHGIRELFSK